jgi:hypothetical protein
MDNQVSEGQQGKSPFGWPLGNQVNPPMGRDGGRAGVFELAEGGGMGCRVVASNRPHLESMPALMRADHRRSSVAGLDPFELEDTP